MACIHAHGSLSPCQIHSKLVCWVQGLSQTAWSYGKLLVPAPALMSAAVQAAARPDSGWKSRDFSDLLWGCARLGHLQPAAAFQEVAALICTALQEHPGEPVPNRALLRARHCLKLMSRAFWPQVKGQNARLISAVAIDAGRPLHAQAFSIAGCTLSSAHLCAMSCSKFIGSVCIVIVLMPSGS